MKYIALLLFTLVLSAKLTPEDEIIIEKHKFNFVENNLFNILSNTAIPEIYGANTDKLLKCGCSHSAHNIMWGAVGMQCKVTDIELYFENEEDCNLRCLSPKGQEIMLFCPPGFAYDCVRGCYAPEDFSTAEQRVSFLEGVTDVLLRYGFDYLEVAAEYLDSCGCTGNLRAIEYGTKLGLDCLYDEDDVDVSECAAFNGCADENGNKVAIFCPAGHTSTCSGCTKEVSTVGTKDVKRRARLDWMTMVLTGWVRESFGTLGLEPGHEQILACGCTEELRSILYGNQVGYYCPVVDPNSVTEECGPNTFCENNDGDLLLHLCPPGFVPNCSVGCGYAWDVKDEL